MVKREGDYFFVSLKQPQERREVLPFIKQVITGYSDRFLTTSGGTVIKAGDLTPDDVREMLKEYVIDMDNPELVLALSGIAHYIVSIGQQLNPYDPRAAGLLPAFTGSHDEFSQQFARELWDYESRDRIKSELNDKTSNRIKLRIIGQLASGKTTFLEIVASNLSLEQANLGVVRNEPEESEGYYPELAMMNSYEYHRDTTRGKAATLGREDVFLYSFSPASNKITQVSIHSAGGHYQADVPPAYIKYGAGALFIDFQSLRELSQLLRSTRLNQPLSNKETVAETVLSLIARLNEWQQMTMPKIGVLTKLPMGTEMSKSLVQIVDKAYWNVLNYAQEHLKELNTSTFVHKPITALPARVGIGQGIGHWLGINDDAPTYSGSLEVLHKLIELSGTSGEQLVTFRDSHDDRQIYYSEALDSV